MTQKLEATTADVILCFQQIPGTDSDTIIDGGDAKILDSGITVKPQGKGYYGLKMDDGATCKLDVLDTIYKIVREPEDKLEGATKGGFTLISWKVLGDKDKLRGVQRRLQLLGYYTGKVDNIMGPKTERAILNFQADNQLRTDRIVGPQTGPKLDAKVENEDKSGDTYVVRRSLVRFTRAPSKTNPKTTSGRPWAKAPDPDDRGFVKVDTMGSKLYGPVVTMARRTDFRVKIVRENVSDDAQLSVSSTDVKVVSIPSPSLPKKKDMILELKANDSGQAEVEVKVKKGKSEIKIGSLRVIVSSLITRLVRPYFVTIADSAGNNPTPPAGTKEDFSKIFDIANKVWWPYGIYFKFLSWREKTVDLSNHGVMDTNTKAEFDDIIKAKDSAGKNTEEDRVNLLIVNQIGGAYGITYDALDYSWPNGIALCQNPSGNIATGIDLAHEFGHFVGLANCFPPNSYVHAEDDPDDSHQKHDIWSIRRLMYGGYPKQDRSDSWAHDVGYGDGQYGCLVSVRNNPKDKTDDECRGARKWAVSKKFYKKP